MISIKAATLDDLFALHALVERAYRGDSARRGWTHEADLLDGQRTDIEGLAAIIDDPAQRILLAKDQNMIFGCVHLYQKCDDLAYLGLLAVEPDMQSGGLGKQLIKAAEQEAADAFFARRVEMTVIAQRADLIAYYERRGYRPTGETRPFPLDNPRFGIPKTRDLVFVILAKEVGPTGDRYPTAKR